MQKTCKNAEILKQRTRIVLKGVRDGKKIGKNWDVAHFDEVKLLTGNPLYNEKNL